MNYLLDVIIFWAWKGNFIIIEALCGTQLKALTISTMRGELCPLRHLIICWDSFNSNLRFNEVVDCIGKELQK